ncbi:RNA polymerase sigma factor [Dactylosporangium salmoneum]|uniref:RNA polymerase sigma factor n=1 Tax=Dactylosporangium salmoneum TaxID=53361 RepID=A0ABP5SNH3_9ACTN
MTDVEDAYRAHWAYVLAATVRVTRDLDLAEECAQEAFAQALAGWPRDGPPSQPAAWLVTVAKRRALDTLRREQTLRAKLPLLVVPDAPDDPDVSDLPDDRLRLVFTCCHPALARDAQVALTLRLVCGVATPDVAKAFLVSEATMAARVTRAKKKIAAARIPFRVPRASELPERLDAVLSVVHLLYASGHTAASGPGLLRADLTGRAVHLARMLHRLMPDEPEAAGLLALVLLLDARKETRTGPDGRLLRLDEQDRTRWDRALIEEGRDLVLRALRYRGARPAGRYLLQAAIAALHAEAPSFAETDWRQIVELYDGLRAAWPSPVVDLNRAVALSMADGPETALREVERLEGDPRLAGYHYLPAVKADLLDRLGRAAAADEAFRAALALTANEAEREYLRGRLSRHRPDA